MDQLRERVLISRDSCPEIAQTRGHRGRKRCEAAAERSWMAGWGIQSDSVSRGPVVQIGQAVTIRPVADLLRTKIVRERKRRRRGGAKREPDRAKPQLKTGTAAFRRADHPVRSSARRGMSSTPHTLRLKNSWTVSI